MALVQMNFQSQYLQSNHEITVILPDRPWRTDAKDFYSSGKKYPVLYLLHGTFGDHSDWIRKSNIELYACENDLIVVMPSGLNANYQNWSNFALGYDMYNYLFEELMPLVTNWFPASSKREDTFIAGLSMGGGGTALYAAQHPEKFAGAAILSSAPRNLEALRNTPEDKIDVRTKNIIAMYGGLEGYINSVGNSWAKLDELVAKKADLPKLYFACGLDDMLLSTYTTFKEHAKEIGLDAKFEEFEGYKHEWRFWDLTIQRALAYFGFSSRDCGNPF